MRPALLLVAAFGFLPLAYTTSGVDPPQVPCTDARGCPDLATAYHSLSVGTQRTEFFPPNHCAVIEGAVQAGSRQIVRVSFTFGNIGKGDLELGAPSAHPDWFEWSWCHGHYHVKEHAEFRVWTPTGYLAWDALRSAEPNKRADQVLAEHPELLSQFVAGKKQGFCVVSQEPFVPGPNGVPAAFDFPPDHSDILFQICNTSQGQDPGWSDTYILLQDGMWVDVTGLPTGEYILEGEMNSNHFVIETRYDNNRAFVPLTVVAQL